MDATLEYVLVALNIFALSLQGLGTYLLIYLYRNDRDSPRLLYLIHLSVIGLLKNIISILSTPLVDMFKLSNTNTIDLVMKLQDWVGAIGDGINVLHYVLIGYITIDRFLEIWWNITYPVHWNLKRAKYLLLGTWIGFSITFVSILITEESKDIDILYPNVIYVYACLDVILIILFVCTHGYLFHKYAHAQRTHACLPLCFQNTVQQSYLKIFRNSTFFISTLLILNFIVLRVIPDLLFTFVVVIPKENNIQLLMLLLVAVTLSDIIDGCIYILNARVVKDLILKVINRNTRQQVAVSFEETAL